SFDSAWVDYIRSLFTELDTDGDGRLQPEEIAVQSTTATDGPSREALQLARNADLWSADRNPLDQTITMDELTAFLVANDRGPFQSADTESAPVISDSVRSTLFELLDQNADRTLSGDELAAAMTSLHRRDLDDDGTFGTTELGVSSNPYMPRPVPAAVETAQPFVALTPGSASLAVMKELQRRYAPAPFVASGNRSSLSRDLSRKELGLEAEDFQQFDFDGNGTLDHDELRDLIRRPPPTLEIIVRLDTQTQGEFVVETLRTSKQQNIAVRRSAEGLTSIVINDVQIEIAQSAIGPDVAKQYLLGQFAAADSDKNNYIDEKELGRSLVFKEPFAEFDEDGDGKLFENELTTVIDSRMKSARCRIQMNINNRGRNLFEILDVDRNRILGRRELAEAVKRIELWDTDSDGAVSESEIPQLYQVSFGPGQPEFPGIRIPGQAARSVNGNSLASSVRPVWFTKLDYNNDGELTRREFPGTIAEFQKLDQNSDGVVDATEATFVK
ncbi:MAG: hypothetical protein O2856_09970, partial [Planctomycetota bacterium]|nr:hypothetical protein [Planctomycetota bacterium]